MSPVFYKAFTGYGIELEYMIVDKTTHEVMPISDRILHDACKSQGLPPSGDVTRGEFEWSNELVLHVLEMKTNGPAADLARAAGGFHQEIQELNNRLDIHNACLAPTAMHPWMNPEKQMKLWPHDNGEIYDAYNKVFGCKGHGWSNLQSMHINLPFASNEEFGRLHAAIRLILPLIPAIASSSPYVEGTRGAAACNRLEFYRRNQARVPSIAGLIIPEAVFSKAAYDQEIFQKIYRDIRPHDPAGILQHEWLNSRGAIARFDRNAIEIRLIDTQERPNADLAIADLLIKTIKDLYEEKFVAYESQVTWAASDLAVILDETIRSAERCTIYSSTYGQIFGIHGADSMKSLINQLIERHIQDTPAQFIEPLTTIRDHGTLGSRMIQAHEKHGRPLADIIAELCACLSEDRSFVSASESALKIGCV